MIRIKRGSEPQGLAQVRARQLPKAVAATKARADLDFDGYRVAHAELYRRQHGKCAYCERQAGDDGQPVEHFRPKAEAWRGDPWVGDRRPEGGYWWLAWTWENLLFACATCNCASRKGNWFPLAPGTRGLAPPRRSPAPQAACFRLDREEPLLLDPAVDDPLDHLAWRPLDPDEPVERMEWRPVHRTERGRYTIEILGLARASVDHVGDHIRRVVYPAVAPFVSGAVRGQRRAWSRMLTSLFYPTAPYLAATHGAIDFFVPEARRAALGVELPRPAIG
ncbi:MAG: hypothetical protein KBG48_09460 [Kofleriaceae bacterium]|nr:hypothetical protein [Kofleriaceae bacterium]MBP9167603.1 hypothetical protein [Kofleriaceae bacterium]MBP9856685.1 hypothetical protein [Kofleriaceae bacterium]